MLIYLPTRSPELNPIELLWNTLCQRLKSFELSGTQKDRVATAAAEIMDAFTHNDVYKCYRHCGYIN